MDRFNLPYYAPTEEEVKDVIQTEGSFNIQQFETFEVDWDSNMDDTVIKALSMINPLEVRMWQ